MSISTSLRKAATTRFSGHEVVRGNGIRAFVQHIRFSGNEFAVSFDF